MDAINSKIDILTYLRLRISSPPSFSSRFIRESGSYCYPHEYHYIRNNLLGENSSETVFQAFKENNKFSNILCSTYFVGNLIGDEIYNPDSNIYMLANYYVKTDTFDKLNMLFQKSDSQNGEAFVISGEKGAGKTALQNYWLYKNSSKLEEERICWINCSAYKLYEQWSEFIVNNKDTEEVFNIHEIKQKVANINDFLNISFLYDFVKACFKKDDRQENDRSNGNKNLYMEVSAKIKETKPIFDYPNSRKNVFITIRYDLLTYLQFVYQTIEIFEKSKSGDSRNYAFDKLMYLAQDSQQLEKRRWIAASQNIQSIFKAENITILKMVDGVDNIHVNKETRVLYELMLSFIKKFIEEPDKNTIHYLNIRSTTLNELEERVLSRPDDKKRYKDTVHSIKLSPATFKAILGRRFQYAERSRYIDPNDIYGKILKVIIENVYQTIEQQTHLNSREYLQNKISLSLQVLYRLYQLKPFEFHKSEYSVINDQAEILRPRNRYLNGRFFLKSSTDWIHTKKELGICSVNIFFYNWKEYPYKSPNEWFGLCKTRILQILNRRNVLGDVLVSLLKEVLGYPEELIRNDIDYLIELDMLRAVYGGGDSITYEIKSKGTRYLEQVYGDINTLYYFALDSALPSFFLDKELIRSHSNAIGQRTNYPLSAISTALTFISFLLHIAKTEEIKCCQLKEAGECRILGGCALPFSDKRIYKDLEAGLDQLYEQTNEDEKKLIGKHIQQLEQIYKDSLL
jgi:hypothetical protein